MLRVTMHCIVYIMMLYDVDVVTFKVPHVIRKCVTLPSLCLSLSTNPEFSHSFSHRLSHSIVFQNPFFLYFP